MSALNPHLTAANEADVTRLIQTPKARELWQTLSRQFNKTRADRRIATEYKVPLSTVRAAINANPEESTLDEVVRLFDKARED